jgi:hypothetical protein
VPCRVDVHRKIFNALVKYLRSPAVPYKGRIIALLSQLLSSPQLFSTTDGPELSGGLVKAYPSHFAEHPVTWPLPRFVHLPSVHPRPPPLDLACVMAALRGMEALVLRRAADEQAKQHFFLPTRLVQLVSVVPHQGCSRIVYLRIDDPATGVADSLQCQFGKKGESFHSRVTV